MPDRMKSDKFWAFMGILVFLLLNYPLLEISNRDVMLVGIPFLVLYLHGVWIMAIIVLYVLGRRLTSRD